MKMDGKSRPIIIGRPEITLEGQRLVYTLKRSYRARNLRVEVRPDTGVTVFLPHGWQKERAESFLVKKSRWILSHLRVSSSSASFENETGKKQLQTGEVIPFLGRELRVVISRDAGKTDGIEEKGNELRITIGSSKAAGTLLTSWYRQKVAEILPAMLTEIAERMNLHYRRLFIRNQKTRWGSCSHLGNISLNWKLVKMPREVVVYVMVHELAHLKEMNHTARFWALVSSFCPDWRQHRSSLKKVHIG